MSTHQVLSLPSNSNMTYYPDNTISQFKVELATTLTLVEPHEAALVGLHYTRSWYNFSTAEVFNICYDREGALGEETAAMSDDDDDEEEEEEEEASSYRPYSPHLESGHYLDIWQVLKQLNLKSSCGVELQWGFSQCVPDMERARLDCAVERASGQEAGLARASVAQEAHAVAAATMGPGRRKPGRSGLALCPLWLGSRQPFGGRQKGALVGCCERARPYGLSSPLWTSNVGLVTGQVRLCQHHWGPHNRGGWTSGSIWERGNVGQGPPQKTFSILLIGERDNNNNNNKRDETLPWCSLPERSWTWLDISWAV